jgi:hypothetical protein
MFKDDLNQKKQIKKIINELCSFTKTKMHDRHYDFYKCQELGLKVKLIKSDDKLYDLIMEGHYAYLYSCYRIPNIVKIIETNLDNSFILYGVR